jgi:signal transduction histidine kinase
MRSSFLRLVDRSFFAGLLAQTVALLICFSVGFAVWIQRESSRLEALSDRVIEANRFALSESFFIIETLGTDQYDASPALVRATEMMRSQDKTGSFRSGACGGLEENNNIGKKYRFTVGDRELKTCVFWSARPLNLTSFVTYLSALMLGLLVFVGLSWLLVRNKVNNRVVIPLLESLEDSVRMKAFSDLATQVSHDIRSPIAAIRLALAELDLKNQETLDDLRAIALTAADRLDAISNGLLDGRRAGAEWCSENVDLVETLEAILKEKRIELACRTPLNYSCTPGLRFQINKTQATEFGRVLSNLVNNASEASSVGSEVCVSLSLAEDSRQFTLLVADSGSGIPHQLVKRLMLGEAVSTKEQGNGLGLSSAKRFADEVGGAFDIQSQLGLGTRISLAIPIHALLPN